MKNLYEISISLQLSGAVLLLLWSFSKMSKNVLNMCFPGIVFASRRENGDVYIDRDIIRSKVKTILLNVCAFCYITVGYLLPIFSESNTENQMYTFVSVVVLSVVFIVSAHFISKLVSIVWIRKDRTLTDDEITEYNIHSEVSEQEVLALFGCDVSHDAED